MNLQDIEDAQLRIAHSVHRTPLMVSSQLNEILGCELLFKCENFQKVGAFKARGAANAVALLDDATARRGVATHSSGNHGAALAFAARARGIPAWVVMPANAPQVKKDAVAGYGATVVECAPTQAAREAALALVVQKTDAHPVPPFDDERIIIGQGTCALELYQQLGEQRLPLPDILMAPVGGGGLLAGTAIASKALHPEIRVIGAEPAGADDTFRSLVQGARVTDATPDTIADGLRTIVGVKNFAVIQQQVDQVLLASEASIVRAMELIWTRLKIIIEPSSAVPLAAILDQPEQFRGKNVAIILSGGNVELSALPF